MKKQQSQLIRVGDACFIVSVDSKNVPQWKIITIAEWRRLGGVVQ